MAAIKCPNWQSWVKLHTGTKVMATDTWLKCYTYYTKIYHSAVNAQLQRLSEYHTPHHQWRYQHDCHSFPQTQQHTFAILNECPAQILHWLLVYTQNWQNNMRCQNIDSYRNNCRNISRMGLKIKWLQTLSEWQYIVQHSSQKFQLAHIGWSNMQWRKCEIVWLYRMNKIHVILIMQRVLAKVTVACYLT